MIMLQKRIIAMSILFFGAFFCSGCGLFSETPPSLPSPDKDKISNPSQPPLESTQVILKTWREQQGRIAVASVPVSVPDGRKGFSPDQREALLLAEKLMDKGYPRLAGTIIKKKVSPDRSLAEWPKLARLGREIGDGELFWMARPAGQSADEYWKSSILQVQNTEMIHSFLAKWPAHGYSNDQYFNLLTGLFFRPGRVSTTLFLEEVVNLFPSRIAEHFRPLLRSFEPLIPSDLILAVIYPGKFATSKEQMIRIVDFQSLGFSLSVFKPLWPGLLNSYKLVILTMAYSCGDFETLLKYEGKPETCPWAQDIRDYLVSLEPSHFQELFGSRKACLRMRNLGLKELEKDLRGLDKNASSSQETIGKFEKTASGPSGTKPDIGQSLANLKNLIFRRFEKENPISTGGRLEEIASNAFLKHFTPGQDVNCPLASSPDEGSGGKKEKKP